MKDLKETLWMMIMQHDYQNITQSLSLNPAFAVFACRQQMTRTLITVCAEPKGTAKTKNSLALAQEWV